METEKSQEKIDDVPIASIDSMFANFDKIRKEEAAAQPGTNQLPGYKAPPATAQGDRDEKNDPAFEKNFMNMFENLAKQLENLDDGADDAKDDEPMDENTIK